MTLESGIKFMKTTQRKPKPIVIVGEISERIARAVPQFDEVDIRFLEATKKRPDRVKLTYKARRKTLTVPYSNEIGDFEVQAMAELIERGVDIASIHTPPEGPSRLAICQGNRPVLNQIFQITK
jgi:hypothetical protein